MQDFKAAAEPSSGGESEPSQAGGGGVGECEPGEADEPTSVMMKGKGSGGIKAKQRDVGGGDDARVGALRGGGCILVRRVQWSPPVSTGLERQGGATY
jgi:hypothetical protein